MMGGLLGARRLIVRSIAYHRRSHVAIALGVITGTATLTGALLVGDSIRGSLRDAALSRLGSVQYALMSSRFFPSRVAEELNNGALRGGVEPLIVLRGGIRNTRTGANVNQINVYGAVDNHWKMTSPERLGIAPGIGVTLNGTLATELGAGVGDDVILHIERAHAVPVDTLLGRRDEMAASIRLTVIDIRSDGVVHDFSLVPAQTVPRNAFVQLRDLQRALKQQERVNAILLRTPPGRGPIDGARLAEEFRSVMRPEDCGVSTRVDIQGACLVVESARLLLEPPVEAAALASAKAMGADARRVLTYLVNDISVGGAPDQAQGGGIPYSVATALEGTEGLTLVDGSSIPALGADDILLNEWAADDLGAKPGDRIQLTYYVSRPGGTLDTQRSVLTLRGIVRMTGLAADAGLTPPYEGITDMKRLGDWNPPFPMDMRRIRDKDEWYWDRYRATPKAFVALGTGLRMWSEGEPRFGRLTSIRVTPSNRGDLVAAREQFVSALRARLDPSDFGLAFEPVRQNALKSAEGNTDFGMLFVSFSFFLIASAAMLVALLFRLNVERRARQLGLMLALGFRRRQAAGVFLAEGAIIAALAGLVGLVLAAAYAWLMLAGLGSWWAGAARTSILSLHLPPATLAVGWILSWLVSLVSIGWAIHGLSRMPPRALLAGSVSTPAARSGDRVRRTAALISLVAFFVATVLIALASFTDSVSHTAGFFGGGAALLVTGLAALARWLARRSRSIPFKAGPAAIVRLAARNASRHRGRSLLTAGLIASASFIVAAVGANRHGVDARMMEQSGGTGGYRLIGESTVPMAYDLGLAAGQTSLGLSEQTVELLRGAHVMVMRLRPGDDASCINLYQARRPRILGATRRFIERGGFRFSGSLARGGAELLNPWLLLTQSFDDGAVPAIADATTVQWLLHLGLGKDFVLSDEQGRPARLRIVGMMAGSVLQGELVISEDHFLRLFPSTSGYGAMLIDVPSEAAPKLRQALERDLVEFGLDLESTEEKLAEYLAVENAYLAAFGTLGGLGLVLGSLGLAAVMLRNVLERRGELGLLRVLGFRRWALAFMLMAENTGLLLAGLTVGLTSALLAIAPHAASSPADTPWLNLAAILAGAVVVGIGAGGLALRDVLRAPLIPALRSE